MKWQVRLSRRAVKNYQKLPWQIQERFKALALELRPTGPVQPQWPHQGKIKSVANCYHCHVFMGLKLHLGTRKLKGLRIIHVEIKVVSPRSEKSRFIWHSPVNYSHDFKREETAPGNPGNQAKGGRFQISAQNHSYRGR